MADAIIRVKATDDASKTLKGIAGGVDKLGKAAKKTGLRVGGASAKLTTFGKRIERVRIGIARLRNRMLLVAFATGVLTAAFVKVIAAAKVQEDAEKKLNATLRSTAEIAGLTFKELTKMASGLQKITTFGDEAIIEAQSLLLTFTKIGKDVFPTALKSILDVSKGMGQDLKASTLQLGKALNDPIQGIAALTRVGITLSSTQEDQIRKFVELNDVASAQAIILGELQTQFGGQAEAAKEGLGEVDQLGNAFGDLVEDIGFAIADSVVFTTVINTLKVSFEALSAVLGRSDEERKIQTANQILLNKAQAEQITLAGEIEKATNSNSRAGFVSNKTIEREKQLREELIPKLQASVDLEKKLFQIKKENAVLNNEAAEASKTELALLEKQLEAMEADVIAFEEDGKKKIAARQAQADHEALVLEVEAGLQADADTRRKEQFAQGKQLVADDIAAKEEAAKKEMALEQAKRQAVALTASSLAGAFATLASINKRFAGIAKATALANATIQGFLAVQRALASSVPPFNFIAATAVGIATAANVAKIASVSLQTPFGQDRVVPGPSNQAVPAIVHGGERIGRGGGGPSIMVNFNGITGDPSETAQQVITLIRQEESRTGFGV